LTISNDGIYVGLRDWARWLPGKSTYSQPKTRYASRPKDRHQPFAGLRYFSRSGVPAHLITIAPGLYPILFIACAVPVGPRSGHTLERFAETPAKGQGHLPAVPAVRERGFGLLEIDIAVRMIGIEDITHRQLQRGLVMHDLLGDRGRSLA